MALLAANPLTNNETDNIYTFRTSNLGSAREGVGVYGRVSKFTNFHVRKNNWRFITYDHQQLPRYHDRRRVRIAHPKPGGQ
ncbi:hypothetical protein EQU24_08670 [Methylotuvimicrobium buryatense]|uniref:Uncharacterized protein n=1 Tax=Methylotuvimicrobium buryatense TaxID=95641 RepID=A0A4P9UM22_METBY|nr:hypothetical protein EQU24_08670 [Methylotuvimicrobium buryatense]